MFWRTPTVVALRLLIIDSGETFYMPGVLCRVPGEFLLSLKFARDTVAA